MELKCIDKFRGKNNIIIGYRLVSEDGVQRDISSEELKKAMQLGIVDIINLQLTSDNRIIDKNSNNKGKNQTRVYIGRQFINKINCNKALTFKSNIDIDKTLNKAKTVGCKVYRNNTHLITIDSGKEVCVASDIQITLTNEDEREPSIGKGALFAYTGFKSIKFAGVDSSRLYTMAGFLKGAKVERVELKGLNTSNVVDMSDLVSFTSIKNLDLSMLDTSRVEDMQEMFSNCNKLEEINLANINTKNVRSMRGMFRDCYSLKRLNLENFVYYNVECMEDMFRNCGAQGMEYIKLGNLNNTKKLKHTDSMFYECNVVEIDLRGMDTSKVVGMRNMFAFSEAENILIDFKTDKVKDMMFMFAYSNVRELDITSFKFKCNACVEDMFKGADNLKQIKIRKNALGNLLMISKQSKKERIKEMISISNCNTEVVLI